MSRSQPRAVAARLFCALVLAGCGGGFRLARAAPRPSPVAPVTPAAQGRPDRGLPPPSPADVRFMSGMIVHHAQAVLMAGWAATHDAGPAVRELCERIIVSQRDEIAALERWLRERHQSVPDADTAASRRMSGMEQPVAGDSLFMPGMPGMTGQPALMPGMLTAAQLRALDGARGPAFDRLFLGLMIQHHAGALTMVRQLLSTSGAAQDGLVFQFASDVNADQTAEIDRMRRMLAALPPTPRSQ